MFSSQFPALGDLEKTVLDDLWDHNSGEGKAVHQRVGVARHISLNTIQSTLERLHRKGLLSREKVSHAYVYTPKLPRTEWMVAMIANLIGSLDKTQAGAMLSAFFDFALRVDHANLDRLEALLAARRADEADKDSQS